jgi:hypothetical protein
MNRARVLTAVRAVHGAEAIASMDAERENVAAIEPLIDRLCPRGLGVLSIALLDAYDREAADQVAAGDQHVEWLKAELPRLLRERLGAARIDVERYLGAQPPFPAEDDPVALDVELFRACRLERDEVVHTRMLGHLLNPATNHGLGVRPMNTFMRLLEVRAPRRVRPQGTDAATQPSTSIRVDAELRKTIRAGEREIDRRLDLVVRDADRCVLVEAKIDADESDEQLADYVKLRRRSDLKGALLVFVTPDGRVPASADAGRDWICVSWLDIAAVIAVAVVGSESRGAQLARLWASGILREIAGLDPLARVRSSVDERQYAALARYLSIWRSLEHGERA